MAMLNFALSFILTTAISANAQASNVEFRKKKIRMGSTVLTIEVAETFEEQSRGLMFRKKIEDSEGMLFVYPDENVRRFWMKNTFIPLSIGFFDKNRVLVDIQDMDPVVSEMQQDVPTYQSREKAMYALEVKRGWFKRHGVKLKTRFDFVTDKPAPGPSSRSDESQAQ